jgi:hypothetical protein
MLGEQTGKGAGSGELTIKVIRGGGKKRDSLLSQLIVLVAAWWAATYVARWKIKNALTTPFLIGWANHHAAKLAGKLFGWNIGISELRAELLKADGTRINYGVVSHRVVTNAFIAALIDHLDNNGATISAYNFHGVGTGTTAEAAGDTALVTESTTILTVDSTRATGTRTQPTAADYRSTATQTFDGSGAITEHGMFNQAATGGGGLMDRSVFSAINVSSGDGIQFTYTYTQTGS